METKHNNQDVTVRDIDTMSREAVIEWLIWNDSNGCYSDEDCKAEGMEPMQTEEARDIARNQIADCGGEIN